VYGLAAALAAFARRPEALLSIAHTSEVRGELNDMLREAARRRIGYNEVTEEVLSRMAGSVHHEGVCLLVRPSSSPSLLQVVDGLGQHGLVLALDGVQNPHNVGAILRSAAYFGVSALLWAEANAPTERLLTPSARRVAEGGAEYVALCRVPQLSAALAGLAQRGLTIVGSDARAEQRADRFAWPARCVLVVGHERAGLSPPVRAVCEQQVRIAGTSRLDSLNVSVAAGVLLANYATAHEPSR
jgi:TrmH RNA methyltransferase